VKKLLCFAMVLALIICVPGLAGAQTKSPSVPDTAGWKEMSQVNITFRVSDNEFVFLGFEVEYSNPADSNEFILIFYRHAPFNSVAGKNVETPAEKGIERDYRNNEERAVIQDSRKRSEPFAYKKYKLVKDPGTKEMVLDGPVESGLWNYNGVWVASTSQEVAGKDLKSLGGDSDFSEFSKDDPENFVVVGKKFTLGEAYNILRIDQDYLSKGGK